MKSFTFLTKAAVLLATVCACTPKLAPETPEQKETTVAVTGVNITRASLELNVGEGFRLGARVSPKNATNARVTWSSDKESVATVGKEDGQVKAVSAGTAIITVTTVDGGFTATCPVTVKGGTTPDPPTPPTPTDPGAPAAFGAVPTEGQLAWQRQELLMFYHYGQATFSGWDGENPTCNGKSWSESLLLQNYKQLCLNAGFLGVNQVQVAKDGQPYVWPTGEWVTLTITCDGTKVYIYDDEELVASYNANPASTWKLGRFDLSMTWDDGSKWPRSQAFNGYIAYARVWSRALGAEDIAATLCEVPANKAEGLEANWVFDGKEDKYIANTVTKNESLGLDFTDCWDGNDNRKDNGDAAAAAWKAIADAGMQGICIK